VRAERALEQPLDGRDDHALHRYRIAVKKARYLAEDLGALGITPWKSRAEREKALQEALGRWNDLRMFCRRLVESRRDAEERGAVTLSRELGRLLATLKPTIDDVRRAAVEASRRVEAPIREPKGDGGRRSPRGGPRALAAANTSPGGPGLHRGPRQQPASSISLRIASCPLIEIRCTPETPRISRRPATVSRSHREPLLRLPARRRALDPLDDRVRGRPIPGTTSRRTAQSLRRARDVDRHEDEHAVPGRPSSRRPLRRTRASAAG
jgi:hypothetical protein